MKAKQDLEAKQKKLLSRKERYQEMYANDLITLTDLKTKVSSIMEELKTVDADLKQLEQSDDIQKNASQMTQHYTEQILRFLELESITNQDMRRILDHISVNREGNVRIVLKKFEESEKL